jgi:N-methylhydantoinase A
MANAARVHAAELGKEVSDHTMIAFGGAAPLHAAHVAEKLGVARVIIPSAAGVGSAVGFLRAPLACDVVVSRPMRLEAYDRSIVADVLAAMQARAGGVLSGRYAALFGRPIRGASVEVLSWQMRISQETWRPPEQAANGLARQRSPARREPHCREVFDARTGHFTIYSVYERRALGPGSEVSGPALIVEDETTTVVTAAFNAHVDALGHLILDKVATPGAHL